MTRTPCTMLLGFCLLLLAAPLNARPSASGALAPEAVERIVRDVFEGDPAIRRSALERLEARGNPDVAPALIQALRFIGDDGRAIVGTLEALTGARPGDRWHEWMLWQEAHPEIEPFDGFDAFKADIMAVIDPEFRLFLRRGVKHEIRLEEIAWGGVVKDGIPALINPTHIEPPEADYLLDDELVFGVQINGDARAYPFRILDWHEMFNDVVGGVPVALAYCTLCGSGILYETEVSGRAEPLVFGSSGFLYRSNKLMYDRQTNSLWNQFTGRPVVGPLTGSGIELKVRPVTITSWKNWLKRHPDTKVLSLDTGYDRDYRPGRAYGAYFASPDLMFPALMADAQLKPKDYVFALRAGEHDKAWPLSDFEGGRVINDAVGDLDVVLIGDSASRTVRAYDARGRDFSAAGDDLESVVAGGEIWRVEEEALVGANGDRLPRLPGHIAYWFAWSGFKAAAPLSGN
ncbi:MAG: DUF3179 domain-containing protein [Proteobacteria bacterium]|nr:DUF3179 domain-containing protein [Pseudomonadota bacterium]